MRTQFARCYLSVMIIATLTSGCATQTLWRHTAVHEWKPGPPLQVFYITDTNKQPGVVAVFCQIAHEGKTNVSRTVGWRVGQSPDQLALISKAIRQLTNSCGNIQSIQVYTPNDIPDLATITPPGFAVWNESNNQLAIHIDGLPSGPFTLPATSQKRNTAMRVGVLPAAIVGDTAIVGLTTAFLLSCLVCAGR